MKTVRESTHTLTHVGIHVTTSVLELPKDSSVAMDALDLTQTRVMAQLIDMAPGINDALADMPAVSGRGATVRHDARLEVMGAKLRCLVTVIGLRSQGDLELALGDRLKYVVEQAA